VTNYTGVRIEVSFVCQGEAVVDGRKIAERLAVRATRVR